MKIENLVYNLYLEQKLKDFESFENFQQYDTNEKEFLKTLNEQQIKDYNAMEELKVDFQDKREFEIIQFVFKFIRSIFKDF